MPRAPANRPTAAVLLIGDELLSGKIRDENGWFLSQRLRSRGVRLLEIATVPDDREEIGRALLRLLAKTPLVFTSGGVGPTHDDVTLEAIGAALDRPLERNEALAEILRQFYRGELNDAAMRMAVVPRGTLLRADSGWPVLRLDLEASEHPSGIPDDAPRIYILPGVPPLLRKKIEALEALEGELPAGPGWVLRDLWLRADESAIAARLEAVVAAYPDIAIGSYPRWDRDANGALQVTLRLTFEGDEAERVDSAVADMRASVADELVLAPPTA